MYSNYHKSDKIMFNVCLVDLNYKLKSLNIAKREGENQKELNKNCAPL